MRAKGRSPGVFRVPLSLLGYSILLYRYDVWKVTLLCYEVSCRGE